jgi:trimethylamine--corrinoid protein Co-methyltransferase
MGTGSLAHDWQAGVQNAQSAMGSMVTPGDIMIGGGSLAAANVFSFAGLVLDAEIMESVYRWMEGIDVSDDALAVDVVRAVGPGGHFLGEAHTLARMGDFQRSGIMNRRGWDEWEAAGRPTPEAAALAEAERLLAEHEPDPLPEDVGVELDRIVRAYEVEAGLRDP